MQFVSALLLVVAGLAVVSVSRADDGSGEVGPITSATTTVAAVGGIGDYSCHPTDTQSNPCVYGATKFYFPGADATHYIQCSEWGQCYDQSCPKGTVWKQSIPGCGFASNGRK